MTRQLTCLLLLGLLCSSFAAEIATNAAAATAATTETDTDIPASTQWTPRVPRDILAQIAERLAADGPLDDIWGLFDGLTNTIRKEQAKHDELSDRQKKECKLERDFRKKEVGDSEAALARATDEKNTCTTALTQNQESLEVNLATQQRTETSISIIEEQRKRDAEHHKSKIARLTDAVNAIDEGTKILAEFFQGQASLVELSASTVKMFTGAVDLSVTELYVPVIAALAQVSQKSELLIDNNVLKRITDLIGVLRNSISDRITTSEKNEAAAISLFQKDHHRLKSQLKDLKTQEATLRANIANYNQCILTAENIIVQASNKRDRNRALLRDANKMCKTFEDEYKEATSQRKAEIDLINKMKEICKKKLKFSKQVTKRGEEDRSQWKKHKNVAVIDGPPDPTAGKVWAPAASAPA